MVGWVDGPVNSVHKICGKTSGFGQTHEKDYVKHFILIWVQECFLSVSELSIRDVGANTLRQQNCHFAHNQLLSAEESPRGLVPPLRQRKVSINIWASDVGDCLLGHYVLPADLKGEQNYTTFLENYLLVF